ncbi:MAG: hypothetical protein E6J90_18100 [Deltaproteobacteria bacterium]|nr:MAG: hypothetical protein E6J90_18100 [Deltaproteobacteria bacterium]TMQ22375.1 MAG: hypothetical protein E6J91_01400 [Deltaproteobacteria bacterium]
MAEFASSTRADAAQTVPGPIDATRLIGDWINCKSDTSYLVRVLVHQTQGRLCVRVWGSGAEGPIEWGEVEATPFSAGIAAGGFCARFVLGQVEIQLATNEKYGVLVIQSYTRFLDGSGRRAHLGREFFRRRERVPAPTGEDRVATPAQSTDVDLAPLAGTWWNSHRETQWWDKVIIASQGGRTTIRPFGRDEPRDWGTTTLVGYRDPSGELAFEGAIDAGPVQARIAANMNKSLMIIAAFHRVAPGDGRSNCFIREFYYRDDDPLQEP